MSSTRIGDGTGSNMSFFGTDGSGSMFSMIQFAAIQGAGQIGGNVTFTKPFPPGVTPAVFTTMNGNNSSTNADAGKNVFSINIYNITNTRFSWYKKFVTAATTPTGGDALNEGFSWFAIG
jgi:hypothetical protein